tara:strand:+ start:30783 stop:31442 length:660 start_codon:yes stop_codon:yes gene_type:complete
MKRIGDYLLSFKNQELILTPEKALFWINKKSLVLSDIHLGKSGHFRKSGIPIPTSVNDNNLERLDSLIKFFDPVRILFLGDLFHSDKNSEWEIFKTWRNKYSDIEMNLAIGNHDFHSPDEYEAIGLICSKNIESNPFLLLHDCQEINTENNFYSISGHIHPSIRLTGKGKQTVRIPCFFFGANNAVLPAFGNFTGTHSLTPKTNDLVFGITNDQIIQIL